MNNINGIPCEILWDSGISEASLRDGPTATVRFKCLTSNRYALAGALMGTTVVAGNQIVRTYPYKYEPSPNLICRSIDNIEQVGSPIPIIGNMLWIGKEYSILTARFEPAIFFDNNSDPSGKPYTATSLNLSSEMLTLPNSTYVFPSGAPTNTPLGKQIPQIQISMKRFMLPYLPINEMASVLGKVNSGVFTVGELACAAGTVLFVGGPSDFTADTNGQRIYTVEYQFIFRAIPWNQSLSPNPTEGWAVPLDGNGDPVFESASFDTLP